jgi:hypothetical protein
MSWSRRNKASNSPPPPRAFMGSSEQQIRTAIKRLAAEQRWMAVRDISVEDLRQLFIPAWQRHSLKEAFGLASPNHKDQALEVDIPTTDPMHHLVDKQRLIATFKWDYNYCPEGFYVPRDFRLPILIQPDAPIETIEKWAYVIDNLGRISWEFGLVNEMFTRLNVNGYCNTPQQMRFVWPAIRHIVDKAGMGLDLVEASARAGDRARVPGEMKEFLVPTVNIVNRTLLMDKIDMSVDRECRLVVNAPGYVIETPASPTGTVVFNGIC